MPAGPRILLSHPHAAAFANGAAAGFSRAAMLSRYAAGVAAAEGTAGAALLGVVGRSRRAALNRVVPGVHPDELASMAPVELLARAAARVIGQPLSAYDAMFLSHDLAVAATPWPRDVTAVYAYEDGARWTFERAARWGVARAWDLPLPHHATLERLWHEEARRWPGAVERVHVEPAWKVRRKDAELALANVISVASSFTADSLREAGVQRPIIVTPYGFSPADFAPRASVHHGPFTVLAVGSHDLRKGTPWLLEAWRRAAIPGAVLKLVGPLRLADGFLAPYRGLFEHVPYVPRAQLGEVYRAADVLAFPTLGDGFGLVIQEAMCCAVPVITTRCGGGPEVVRHGENGWIIAERDVDALVEQLRAASRDRDRLLAMGRTARAVAERWTWEDAGGALAEALAAFDGGKRVFRPVGPSVI